MADKVLCDTDDKGQRGNSLPMALIALVSGVLLVFPVLHHVRASLQIGRSVREAIHAQYAADAAADYALWRMTNDPAWREAVDASGMTGLQIDAPDTINGLSASVRVVKVTYRFHYAIFGASKTCSSVLDWTGAHNRLIGDAHSNRGIKIQGADTVITGTVSYVTEGPSDGQIEYIPPPPDNPVQTYVQEIPVLFHLSDYNDPTVEGTPAYKANQAGHYHYIDGDWQVNESGTVFDGLYFLTGNLKINGNNMSGTATFVTLGTIEVIGSDFDFEPYVDHLTFYSAGKFTGTPRCNSPLIMITGSGIAAFGGYVYAPYGLIRVSGSGAMAGAFIGDSIDLSGSGLTIQVPPPDDEGADCDTYDLMATAGNTDIQVRFRRCSGGELYILSWKVTGHGSE